MASEVKALANQTATVHEATLLTTNATQQIRGTIANVKEIAGSVAAAVEQQGAATQEIARSAQQAASGTELATKSAAEASTISNRPASPRRL